MNKLSQPVGIPAAPPNYEVLAKIYDSAVALPVFPLLCGAFVHMLDRHRIVYDSIADLGCGTGNFLRYVSRKGKTAVGVDNSSAMLDIARKKIKKLPIRFFQQDLRELQLPISVDFISCQFDTLNYFLKQEDLIEVLTRCHQALNPNGHLLFDFITGSGALPIDQNRKIRYGPFMSYWSTHTDPQKNLSRVKLTVTEADNRDQRISEMHVQRWYPLKVVLRLLTQTGFTTQDCFDLERLKPANEHSYWVQVLARKNN
ncbi:class I SAM-dependent DNA methyltransferase [Methylomonas sp. MgM2]